MNDRSLTILLATVIAVLLVILIVWARFMLCEP